MNSQSLTARASNMNTAVVLLLVAVASVAAEDGQREEDHNIKPKRGLFHLDPVYGQYGYEPIHRPPSGLFDLALHHHHPPLGAITIPKKIPVQEPYTVELVNKYPAPVKIPISLPYQRQYPGQFLVEKNQHPLLYPLHMEMPQMYSTKTLVPIFLHQHYHHHHGDASLVHY